MADPAARRHPRRTSGHLLVVLANFVENVAVARASGTRLALPHRHGKRPTYGPLPRFGRHAAETLLDALRLRPAAALDGVSNDFGNN